METQKYQLSEKKIEELQLELKELETKGRKEIADSLDWLRSLPNDLEDVTFSDYLDEKSYLEKRISELKTILSNCEQLPAESDPSSVDVGNRVLVGFEGFENEYLIVSAIEADPMNNRISDQSPVGKALIGKKVGDIARVETGNIKKEFRILKIE